MEARDQRRLTLEAYLELDRTSEDRWEYVNGQAFAMAASPEHNLVKGNVYAALKAALVDRPCIAYPDGQKLSTPATGAYHYPDVSVYCGRPERDANDPNAFTNPTLIVEVLSPHTADYDRGGKFVHYRGLPSLQEYVTVSIEERRVERHRRLETAEWLMTERLDGSIDLASIGVTLPLAPLWSDLESLRPIGPPDSE